ncbi:hypothetical protein HDK77DRAFT_456205 [Phyllosticta capitalensis]|uniref:Pre-rRNA processing protein n=2 Tax=Phyllosticta capitalensis TaxID=121624 RepID=A0ABR1YBP1_9PEZI
MSDTPWGSTATPNSRPASTMSAKSKRSTRKPPPEDEDTEQTPLLVRDERTDEEEDDDDDTNDRPTRSQAAWSLLGCLRRDTEERKTRWPSLVALLILCLVVILIMIVGFFAPAAVEQYAKEAVVFEPTGLSFQSLTPEGVSVRVQGDFSMDASRVDEKSVRDFGRFGTWIARSVKSGETKVEVVLPDYSSDVVGSAIIPPLKVDIRNGHVTHVDFVADLKPGSFDSVRDMANDWMHGRLSKLKVQGNAQVPLKSGIFPLGTTSIKELFVFSGNAIPAVPAYEIDRLQVHEKTLPDARKGVEALVSLSVNNQFPLDLTVPALGFGILVANCKDSDPYIMVADAITDAIVITPYSGVEVNVTGVVRQIPDELMENCPGKKKSPLDLLINDFMNGEDPKIFVRGSDSPDVDTPRWITDLMSEITVPIPVPGELPQNLLKNFSLTDVHFRLPSVSADPGTPEAQPRIDANVKALVGLPKQMNLSINVDKVRADADIFYHGKKLGYLDLNEWQPANATRVHSKNETGLLVQSEIKDAPLFITDEDLFTKVVQALLFGKENLVLSVKAEVDVEMVTGLGSFKIRKIPAKGVVPVKPIGSGGGLPSFSHLSPQIGNLSIVETTPNSIHMTANVNFTNPTKYTAEVPYADIYILTNSTVMGHVTARDLYIGPGNNTNILVEAVWDPLGMSGTDGKAVGRELLSQWLSGWNTTLELKTHNATIPALPSLGYALSPMGVKLATPKLGGDDGPHFIRGATMHLISSTAIFNLASPLSTTTLYVTHLNATALYHENPVGRIEYDLPFAVPPGISETPRLPVDWSLGSVGYEALRKALGGQLRLNASADVGLKVGRWQEGVWFLGHGLGASVRL